MTSRFYCLQKEVIGWLVRFTVPVMFCMCCMYSIAQRPKNTFALTYRVLPGETFSSIAQQYNLSARELADFNNIDYYPGTVRSKTLRVPIKRPTGPSKQETQKKLASQLSEEEFEKKLLEELKLSRDKNNPNSKSKGTAVVSDILGEEGLVRYDSINYEPLTKPIDTLTTKTADIVAKKDSDIILSSSPVTSDKKTRVESTTSTSLRDLMPLLIFLLASAILLIAAIFFYRGLKK